MRRHLWFLLVAFAACPKSDTGDGGRVPPRVGAAPRLISVGPRLLSNQTSQPLTITGEGLSSGLKLQFGPPVDVSVPLVALDPEHAYSRLPTGLLLPEGESEVAVPVSLEGAAGQPLTVRLVNDSTWVDFTDLAYDGHLLAAVSGPEDAVYFFDPTTLVVERVAAKDGPSAIAPWVDAHGRHWFVVAHQYAPTLLLIDAAPPHESKTLEGPAMASKLLVDGSIAYVAEQARDTVSAIDLSTGTERWRTPVAPNPRELCLTSFGLAVGSLQTGELELLDLGDGHPGPAMAPGPGIAMLGPATREMRRVKQPQAHFGQYVMGGKAPRSLAWSAKLKRLFVAGIGPNIGPNPDRMEVSMNGGVSSVDLKGQRFERHLGFGAGVTEALALDERRGLLYAADVALGLIRVLDAKKLAAADAQAQAAVLQEIALPVREAFPLLRPAGDFGVEGRAGSSLHSGPKALALSSDGATLYVLNRFTGTIAQLDVSKAPQKKAQWRRQTPLAEVLGQSKRRQGQVLYSADLGMSAMSCDACHLEGHTEGVFFEKTMPMRIYRSPTVRGSRETPPHFTPASTHSMGETARVVTGRNRYHNPDPTEAEVEALTLFSSCIATLPNPFVGLDGAPVERLTLPNGKNGNARLGAALFFGKAQCAGCHPPPHYTTDQDPSTRGRFIDVGTPHAMPLREAMQNTLFKGFGTPSLNGAWDTWPMLTSGLAGFSAEDDARLKVKTRFALEPAVLTYAGKHGRADLLSEQEQADLLAFVMSL